MNKKTISFLTISLFLVYPIYSFAQSTLTPDQEVARIILSTGTDPATGQPATQSQLQQANQTYYGTFYQNLSNVGTNNSGNSNSDSNSSPTVCTGDPRLNMEDALACAQIARQEGLARGLNVSCQVSIATYPLSAPGLPGYYYNIPCTVNGSAGHDAVLLAGYNGTALTNTNLNPTWSLFTNSSPTNTNTSTNNTGTNTSTNTSTGSGFSSANTTYPSTISGVVATQVNLARNALSYITSGASSYTLPTFTPPVTLPTNTSTGSTNTTLAQSCPRINSSLRMGDNGAEVLLLTTELVKEGLLSQSKTTFDAQVYNAVIAYQEKYASSILSPVGLTRGSGFVGPSTISFMNARITCSSTSTGSTNTSGTSTGGGATGLQNQINNLQALIDSLLAQLNGPISTSTGGSANTGTTVTIPTTFSASKTVTGPLSFRYLKVDTKSRSWIAWREIEVYDLQGNKITPTSGQVSCEWCNNNYFRDSNSGGANKTYDGNVMTAWNAGETAPGCDWSKLNETIDACIAANIDDTKMSRVGWIVLDYGSMRNVSKIRMMTENNPNPSNAQHIISVGNSSNPSSQIAAFGGQVPAGTWIEIVVQ